MKYNKILFVILFIFSFCISFSQKTNIKDSLYNKLETTKQDTNRVNTLNKISTLYYSSNKLDSSFLFAKEGLNLSKKLNYRKGQAMSLLRIGHYYNKNNNVKNAIIYYQESLSIYDELSDAENKAIIFSKLSFLFYKQENYDVAISYMKKVLKLLKNTSKYIKKGSVYNNIGIIFKKQEKYDSAIYYYKKAYQVYIKNKDTTSFGSFYNNIAGVYTEQKKYKLANEYLQKSLAVKEKYNDEKGLAVTYGNLAEITNNIAISTKNKTLYYKAIKFAEKSIKMAKKENDIKTLNDSYLRLKKSYAGINDFEKAYYYSELYNNYKDSVYEINRINEVNRLHAKYENEKIEKNYSLLKKTDKQTIETLKNAKKEKFYLYIILLIMFVFISYMVFSRLKSKKLHKEEVRLHNKLKESEAEYKNIIESTSEGCWILNSDNLTTEVNSSLCKMLGYSRNEIIGKSPLDFVDDENAEIFKTKINLIPTTNHRKYEIILKAKSGKDIPVVFNATTIRNSRGKVIKAFAFVTDITKLNRNKEKQIQILKALAESEKNFRLLFENSPLGTYIANIEGTILEINQAALKILGSPSIEATKQINILKFQPLIDNGYVSNFYECIETGKIVKRATFYKTKWGKQIFINSFLIPLKDKSGKITKIYTIMDDITRRKQAENNLIEAKREAEKANKLKSEFLANMSHEIRTPMNAIIGFSNILKTKIQNKKYLEFIDIIVKNGDNLLELINDILDLSKIEAGELTIKNEKANLTNVIEEIQALFAEQSQKKQIPINLVFKKELPQFLYTDAFRIRQVLINLVGNALKFTTEGAVSIIVDSEKLIKQRINLKIQIFDTGIGIPEEELDTIFDSFRQVEGQSTRKYGGTGLGLAITKRLVEIMGGTIKVKSKVGKGSVFEVILNKIEILKNEMLEDKTVTEIPEINTVDTKILHVEDVEDNREIVRLFLENENIEIKEAENGREALEILENYKPKLILMDINMPKLNGYETAKRIKQDKRFKNIPIIAITANATTEEIEKYSHVFDNYITKPITESLLKNTVIKFLSPKKNNKFSVEKCIAEFKTATKNNEYFSIEATKTFKEKLIPLYNKISETLSVDYLMQFADEIKIFAENNNISELSKYAVELETVIKNFNLSKINTLLKDIKKILNYKF